MLLDHHVHRDRQPLPGSLAHRLGGEERIEHALVITSYSIHYTKLYEILFVDDDVNLLRGLRRVLHKQREDWDITFLDSPVEALKLLDAQRFDVVVSDMRMPELDGASLLSEVERRHPGTIRVVLSGYTEEKSVLRTIGPTHQYLAKPCNTDDIVSLLDRTLALKAMLRSEPLRDLATSLHNLPSPSA